MVGVTDPLEVYLLFPEVSVDRYIFFFCHVVTEKSLTLIQV